MYLVAELGEWSKVGGYWDECLVVFGNFSKDFGDFSELGVVDTGVRLKRDLGSFFINVEDFDRIVHFLLSIYIMINYNRDELEKLYLINFIGSCFSTLGSLFIFLMFTVHKKMRNLPFRLIFYLTVADLGIALAFFLPSDNYWICQIQGGLASYFMLSSIVWCGIISHAMSKVIKCYTDLRKYEKIYLILGYIVPLYCFLVLIDNGSYSMTIGWCWIYEKNPSKSEEYLQMFYKLITYYFPLLLIELYIFSQYLSIKKYFEVNSSVLTSQDELKRKVVEKMKIYPLVLFCCQIPCALIRILLFFSQIEWYFVAIAGFGLSINGLANAIVYGITQDVKKKLLKMFKKSRKVEKMSELDCSINSKTIS